MQKIKMERTDIRITPDPSRVLIRPFIPRDTNRITKIISRVLSLPDETVGKQLSRVMEEFAERHFDINRIFEHHFNLVRPYLVTDIEPPRERRLLIGSLFTSEYSLECAALFNPSIIPHPDQTGLSEGDLRFIMSLRATGEGHISSISFRSGILDRESRIRFDSAEPYVTPPEPISNSSYDKHLFARKLAEMGMYDDFSQHVLNNMEDSFTRDELGWAIRRSDQPHFRKEQTSQLTAEAMIWLADSNYQIRFSPEQKISQRIIFPTGPSEQNGIEDARFVQFLNEDGTRVYYATYTAYDGKSILPQLMASEDFEHFRIITLNGKAAQNKGMALFPRKLEGRYAMISRQDNENLYIMYSDNIHFWHEMIPLLRPTYPWEFVQVGNCGTPIETERGWLVLTHGVGPMRKYCIGAVLLDLENPSRVIGRLPEPLLAPNENEREGYVPNVVYTCGALVHRGKLVIPYAMSDYASSVATVSLDEVLEALTSG